MLWLKYSLRVSILVVIFCGCEDNSPELPPTPRYITSFGAWGTDPGEFEYPRPIAVGPDSLLYVGDTGNKRIEIFTNLGKFVRQWPLAGAPKMIAVAPDSSVYVVLNYGMSPGRYSQDGQLISPINLVTVVSGLEVDAFGNLYVSGLRIYGPDPFNPFIEGPYFWKFNSQLELVKKWGYPGPSDTTGWSGGRMTWNSKGNLLVLGEVDSTTTLIEFTPNGELVSSSKIPALAAHLLEDVACDRSGEILISSPFNSLIYVFDSRGRQITEFSEVNKDQEPLDQPAGIEVDSSGSLYVVDFARYRVVKYDQVP